MVCLPPSLSAPEQSPDRPSLLFCFHPLAIAALLSHYCSTFLCVPFLPRTGVAATSTDGRGLTSTWLSSPLPSVPTLCGRLSVLSRSATLCRPSLPMRLLRLLASVQYHLFLLGRCRPSHVPPLPILISLIFSHLEAGRRQVLVVTSSRSTLGVVSRAFFPVAGWFAFSAFVFFLVSGPPRLSLRVHFLLFAPSPVSLACSPQPSACLDHAPRRPLPCPPLFESLPPCASRTLVVALCPSSPRSPRLWLRCTVQCSSAPPARRCCLLGSGLGSCPRCLPCVIQILCSHRIYAPFCGPFSSVSRGTLRHCVLLSLFLFRGFSCTALRSDILRPTSGYFLLRQPVSLWLRPLCSELRPALPSVSVRLFFRLPPPEAVQVISALSPPAPALLQGTLSLCRPLGTPPSHTATLGLDASLRFPPLSPGASSCFLFFLCIRQLIMLHRSCSPDPAPAHTLLRGFPSYHRGLFVAAFGRLLVLSSPNHSTWMLQLYYSRSITHPLLRAVRFSVDAYWRPAPLRDSIPAFCLMSLRCFCSLGFLAPFPPRSASLHP